MIINSEVKGHVLKSEVEVICIFQLFNCLFFLIFEQANFWIEKKKKEREKKEEVIWSE